MFVKRRTLFTELFAELGDRGFVGSVRGLPFPLQFFFLAVKFNRFALHRFDFNAHNTDAFFRFLRIRPGVFIA